MRHMAFTLLRLDEADAPGTASAMPHLAPEPGSSAGGICLLDVKGRLALRRTLANGPIGIENGEQVQKDLGVLFSQRQVHPDGQLDDVPNHLTLRLDGLASRALQLDSRRKTTSATDVARPAVAADRPVIHVEVRAPPRQFVPIQSRRHVTQAVALLFR